MQNQGRKLYAVTILKRDQDHLIVLQTEKSEEAKAIWFKLVEMWKVSIKEQTPFILEHVTASTAFDPGLIYEITIKSTDLTSRVNMSNPYTQDMLQQGFSESFGKYAKGSTPVVPGTEVLDGGYKF